ncbi:MAG: single-stranded-DNA-specific exonuclease RecJ [Spirochaetales bacterium]|nr:single-stranded-DNA-specific exonuclease RecJ [Spirochaetales bacterium]
MKWLKKDADTNTIKSLSSRYNLDLLAATIFVRRGIVDKEEILFFLENNFNFLHNPFNFFEMELAVDRVLHAYEEKEKVLIFGDRDVDGITATVILYKELLKRKIAVEIAVPDGDDAYGLTMEVVDKCFEKNISLIITVDCGISCLNEVKYAKSKGIDVIVTDHHNPPEHLPEALAILNPKLEDSGYPFAHLAGCVVSFKFAAAIRFGFSAMYNHPVTLFNIKPGNDTYILEAVIVQNLQIVDKLELTLCPNILQLENDKLRKFFIGKELFVYDAKIQERMLKRIFGENVDIELIDLYPYICQMFPKLENQSLLRLSVKSKLSAYQDKPLTEIDILFNMFYSFILNLGEGDSIQSFFDDNIELIALGTLADMMPLENENRIIVKKGIEKINTNPSKHFHELLMLQKIAGKDLSSIDISWQISPLINSTGRLGVPTKALDFFMSEDQSEISQMAAEIVQLNAKRKKLGSDAWNFIFPQAKASFKELNNKIVLVASKEFNRGITGILATRLAEYFSAPTIVACFLDDKIVGSMRSYGGLNVKNFLENFTEYFEDFGGHDFAAGFHITHDKWDGFLHSFKSYVLEMDEIEKEEESIYIDADLPSHMLNPKLIELVNQFEPYGEGNQPLVFSVKGAILDDINIIGKGVAKHLKLLIRVDSVDPKTKEKRSERWPALFWNAADRVGIDFNLGEQVDIVFRLGRNYYMNIEQLQLTVLDIKAKGSA